MVCQAAVFLVFASSNMKKIRGAENMKYIKAQDVLPEELVKLLQEYVNGEYLYVPCKDGEKKTWGEKSGARILLRKRNKEIYQKYREGKTAEELAVEYFLSEQSIRRILSQVKYDV
jgi:Mor family transcriptional regulator